MFILDFSGSVEDIFRFYVDTATGIVDELVVDRLGTRVALVTFSSAFSARPIFHLKDFFANADVTRAITAAPYLSRPAPPILAVWRRRRRGLQGA